MIDIMSETLINKVRRLKSRVRALDAGGFLFYANATVERLYWVERGEVHLVRHQAGGSSLILQRAGAGSLVAEASLFSERYHCDAVAAEATTVAGVDKRQLQAALARDTAFAGAWIHHLAREVQATRLRAEILSLRTVAERLDAWLAAHGGTLPPKGAWKACAAEIAVSPEALYRELAQRRVERRTRS